MSLNSKRRKRRLGFSPKVYFQKDDAASDARKLAKGWGQIGVNPYNPFTPVHLFAGHGFSGRLPCPRTREIVHCHSLGEIGWGRILLRYPNHFYLYSQVAIPRQHSERIAKENKIRHPKHRCGTPSVRTTDFVHCTLVDGGAFYEAYSIKSSPDSLSKRDEELAKIERIYFEEQGISWQLRFRSEIDPIVLANIRFVEAFSGVSPFIWGSDCWKAFEPALYKAVASGSPLNEACKSVERKLRMPKFTALTLVRFFLANWIWLIDWVTPIDTFSSLELKGRCPEVEL